MEEYSGAISDLTKAIRLDSTNADYFFYRGYFKSKLGNDKGAIKDFSKSIIRYPYYAETYYNRGINLLHLGLIDDACLDFKTAIELGDTLSLKYQASLCKE
jgi:tetratricopeptide (TPR) repeat protein